MRQRHIKVATLQNLECMGVLIEPKKLSLDTSQCVHLEIGAGKGQFLTHMAYDHKDELFIALEVDKNVCYRIAEKKVALGLDNLIIILGSAEMLEAWITIHSIDRIYLNFSDPWPKARHHKRRLTWPTMLKIYHQLLKENGILQLRTDHLGLFMDSKEYIESVFDIFDVNMQLEESSYMTEYEEKKRLVGPIYQLKGRMRRD